MSKQSGDTRPEVEEIEEQEVIDLQVHHEGGEGKNVRVRCEQTV
jgi:hypothetical protein